MRNCKNCGEKLEGRVDKQFCNSYCKSTYHYELKKTQETSFYKKVDRQLKLNRRLLREFNRSGKSVVRKEVIMKVGFDPNFFTHYWKTQKGDVYLFCFEYGFLKRKEFGVEKFILIKWQSYMEFKQ